MEDSTPLDEHIQSSIWSSVIPIELKLAPDDTATPIPPEPYYVSYESLQKKKKKKK